MKDVFVSWSGGKDCCLALYRAINSGFNVRYLASMFTEHTGRLWPHHLTPEVLSLQAEAMSIPLIQKVTTVADYNLEYMDMLRTFKQEGIKGGVFGDVSIGNGLAEKHRKWVDGVCQPVGIGAYRPLWGQGREELIREFIESGFEAVIIASECARPGRELVGRTLDWDLMLELKRRHELSAGSGVGIYHTFVIDGPLFEKRLELEETDIVLKGNYWYLDILKCGLKDKVAEDWNIPEPVEVSSMR